MNTEIEEYISGKTTAAELIALFPDGAASEWPDFIFLYFVVGERVQGLVDHLQLTSEQRKDVVREFLNNMAENPDKFNAFAGSKRDDLIANLGRMKRAFGISENFKPALNHVINARAPYAIHH